MLCFKILSPVQYILYSNQFGFRKGHSTAMAIVNLIEKISCALDSKKASVALFIDLSKAFDTIDHNILLKKLYHYGIRGVTLDLFANYLKIAYKVFSFKILSPVLYI